MLFCNFLPFQPDLVGGHCIDVDPYYFTDKAHEFGLTPQIILAGRGTNEAMQAVVASKIIQNAIPAVPHEQFLQREIEWQTVKKILNSTTGPVADIPVALDRNSVPDGVTL